MTDIEKIVREELGKIANKDISDISREDNLVEHVGLDSLSILEVFGMMEEKFNIVLEPDKISELQTIADIVRLIEENKK